MRHWWIILWAAGVAASGLGAGPATGPAASGPAAPTAKQVAQARKVFETVNARPVLTVAERRRVEKLIRDLGDDRWRVREAATKALSEMGPVVVPLLTPAAGSKDPEVATRAAAVLRAIEDNTTDVSVELARAVEVLAAARAKGLVPMLIDLLEHPNPGARYAGEYALRAMTGKDFAYNAYADAADRAAAAARWRQWWKANAAAFDFAKVRTAPAAGLLVTDCSKHTITAMTLAGKVVWSHKVRARLYCAAGLANGNVLVGFAAGNSNAEEYTRGFRKVWSNEKTNLGTGGIFDVQRLPNGNTLLTYTHQSHVTELSPAGKVVWQYKGASALSAQRLANGNTLIALYSGSKVVEVDRAGKVVWSTSGLKNCSDARKLPNGNVLIAEYNGKRVLEVNRAGKTVWQFKCPTPPSGVCRLADGTTAVNWAKAAVIVGRDGKVVRTLAKHNGSWGKIRLVPMAVLQRHKGAEAPKAPKVPKPAPPRVILRAADQLGVMDEIRN